MDFRRLSFPEAPVIKAQPPGPRSREYLDFQSAHEESAVSYPRGMPMALSHARGGFRVAPLSYSFPLAKCFSLLFDYLSFSLTSIFIPVLMGIVMFWGLMVTVPSIEISEEVLTKMPSL